MSSNTDSGALRCTRDVVARGRFEAYRALKSRARGDPNDDFVAQIVASWTVRESALPRWMGLGPDGLRAMVALHFSGSVPLAGGKKTIPPSRAQNPELADLHRLLASSRAGRGASERWLAQLVVIGAMGSDHLWSDLGLFSRPQLTRLMKVNFPKLARRNVRNMRWKKFLYKQLCEQEGLYICRAPSCDVCVEFSSCFEAEAA